METRSNRIVFQCRLGESKESAFQAAGRPFYRRHFHESHLSCLERLRHRKSPLETSGMAPHRCSREAGKIVLAAQIWNNLLQPHHVSGQGFWPAGSAALFNQQVWHRGTAHNGMGEPDRVVFIVSFLARPNDTRQLARGTYFHMKWNMW